MIVLPRSLARRFRAVLRLCVSRGAFASFVVLRGDAGGLTLEAVAGETAVRLDHPGPQPEAVLALRSDALALFEGRTDEPVTLAETEPGKGRASWSEAGAAYTRDLATVVPDGLPPFPQLAARLSPLDTGFLRALADAAQTAAQDPTRHALQRVLLRGGSPGQVVASNGRQLLVQSGLALPWKGDVLVPRLAVWGHRELSLAAPVSIGRTEAHVLVRAGSWTFALAADATSRYAPFEDVLPGPTEAAHVLRLSPEDIGRLLKDLPRLGGDRGLDAPVTLDLGPRVTLRLHGTADATAQVIELPDAEWTGVPCKLFTDRRYLLRALKLGFTEVKVRSPSHVVWCRDASRTYVWMPWSESPAPTAARTPPLSASASPEPKKETAVMANAPSNGRHAGSGDAGSPALPAASDPLTEAEVVRGLLAEAQPRLGRLIASLKLHRRQARAVQAAVASLRDLPPLSP